MLFYEIFCHHGSSCHLTLLFFLGKRPLGGFNVQPLTIESDGSQMLFGPFVAS